MGILPDINRKNFNTIDNQDIDLNSDLMTPHIAPSGKIPATTGSKRISQKDVGSSL